MPATSRNTIQRKLVLGAVKSSLHPTAEDVYKTIKTDYPDISLGTVYRNLSLLAERGEIQRVPVPGSADRFDCDVNGHHHVICTGCGAFCDVHGLSLDSICSEAASISGYSVAGHMLIFSGLCPDCRQRQT